MEKAETRLYISQDIRLGYSNTENLKYDIQDLMTGDIKQIFLDGLRDIQGDKKESKGTHIRDLAKMAMAYFYTEIFPKKHPIRDSYWTLESVKGFLDANNLTYYTPIHEVPGGWFPLVDASLLPHCWLIIQSAWFFNSPYFGHHQHIDYLNHFVETGEKLPIESYRYDKIYLEKKYKEVAKSKSKINGFRLVEQWHYFVLFLVACELQLPIAHFERTYKGFRDYNPLTKCPRQLRPLTPFMVVECDIKSAFPTFLDYHFDCNLKGDVYNNLMKSKGISRSEAKIMFNKKLNSGKYLSKGEVAAFLRECGYPPETAKNITNLTHDPDKIFLYHMTEYEEVGINIFKEVNNLHRAGRLHDSVLFIHNGIKPIKQSIEDGAVVFGYRELSRPVVKSFFAYSDKRLPYARISSLPGRPQPEPKPFVSKKIFSLPNCIGEANGFKFFEHKYEYISADFDLNEHYTYSDFINQCRQMFSTLHYLNARPVSNLEMVRILTHIRMQSNIIFSIRHTSRFLVRWLGSVEDVEVKSVDFLLTKELKFKKKIDFLNAYNEARKIVNQGRNLKSLCILFENCIKNDEYPYLSACFVGKKKNTVLERAILKRWNKLTTGFDRKPRVKGNPLYKHYYKEGCAKLSKRNSKRLNDNILRAKNWSQILFPLVELEIPPGTPNNKKLIKAELKSLERVVGKEEMKRLKLIQKNSIVPHTPTINDFDADMTKSVFNQVDDEEAYYRGEQFYKEYEQFHKRKSQNGK